MRFYKQLVVLAMCWLVPTLVCAEGVAIGVRPLNTLGLTGEITGTLYKETLNARLGVNVFSFNDQGTAEVGGEVIGYDAGFRLNSLLLTLDWHPGGKNFRVAPGLFYNRNEFSGDFWPTETIEMGTLMLTPEKLGQVSASVDYPPFAPYLGIGWGNAVRDGRVFRFAFDLGLIYMQSPQLEMSATKLIAPTAEQEGDINEKLEDYSLWLVLSLGVSFKVI